MLPEIENYKDHSPEKESTRKMILVAKDYVHYLRRRDSTKAACTDGDSDTELTQVDGTYVEMPKFSQLLASLRDDLRCATSIFLEEFIGSGGVECLLDVLRLCQSRQSIDSAPLGGRQQHRALRKALTNQHDCLLCLKYVTKNPKSIIRMTDHAHGLNSIASCFMSSYCKSRVVSLELLTRVLDVSSRGHALILEAMTAIRVVFGEPVRFKFLVSMLNGNSSAPAGFEKAALRFLNALLRTSPRSADRIRLQCEFEEAGLDISALETQFRDKITPPAEEVRKEIEIWRKSYLDMENVTGEKRSLETENVKLHQEVQLLRQALKKLEEDKINLMHIEMELKEKCDDLNEEVTSLKSEIKQTKPSPDLYDMNSVGFNEMNLHNQDIMEEDEEDLFLPPDHGQLETEEIFIDVPTIRPPVGFRSDPGCDGKTPPNGIAKIMFSATIRRKEDESFHRSTTIGKESPTSTGFESKTESSDKDVDSALSESESDSGINWRYPELPQATTSFVRNSRSKEREDDLSHHLRFPMFTGRRIQRSQSEDRRETTARPRRDICEGETKVVGSSGFFLVRRPNTDLVSRHSSLPPRVLAEPPRFSRTSVNKNYPLPVAYRSNFLLQGHSNCDLYSGIAEREEEGSPHIPPPDYSRGGSVITSGGTISALVHREITKAVRQISGWI